MNDVDLILSRARIQACLWIFLLCAATPLHAEEAEKLAGVPMVEDNGSLAINGQHVALWGVDLLASDQQCWQGDISWCCGEHSRTALRHFVENKMVECVIKQRGVEGALPLAQCSRFKDGQPQDIAEFLILKGWAIEKPDVSGGAYFQAENKAQVGKYGIWTSRFQTAQDWREGIQRFVGEEGEDNPPPPALQFAEPQPQPASQPQQPTPPPPAPLPPSPAAQTPAPAEMQGQGSSKPEPEAY